MKDSPIKSLEQSKEDEEEKAKRSRRSKADTEGRNFECSICGKSYLSNAALYTHKKNKHKVEDGDAEGGEGKKRRQKAKTEDSENATAEQLVNAETLEYFSTNERKGLTTLSSIHDIFRDVFNDIFLENWENQFKASLQNYAKYNEWEKYPLYTLYIKQESHTEEPKPEVNNELKCDEVLVEYLAVISSRTNSNYFRRVVKFIFLFREFLNMLHRGENSEQEEFTSINTAENSPDSTNEFILDFMGLDEPKLGYHKDESIQLTQNLCRWMFDHKYTYSKLTIK